MVALDKTDKEFKKLMKESWHKVPSHNFFRCLFVVSLLAMIGITYLALVIGMWWMFLNLLPLLTITMAMHGITYWWHLEEPFT